MNEDYSNLKYVALAIILTIFSVFTSSLNTLASFTISLMGIIVLAFCFIKELKKVMEKDKNGTV